MLILTVAGVVVVLVAALWLSTGSSASGMNELLTSGDVAARAAPRLAEVRTSGDSTVTDWSKLRHAYGIATDIPALLERLPSDRNHELWNELWSRLCHQGTVYNASFAALPALERLAREAPEQREAALALAGAIVASKDRFGVSGEPLREHATTIASLYGQSLDSLTADSWSPTEFIYKLQTACGLRGDHVWGRRLDALADGEIQVRCPSAARSCMWSLALTATSSPQRTG